LYSLVEDLDEHSNIKIPLYHDDSFQSFKEVK